jgi:hypothetical protein
MDIDIDNFNWEDNKDIVIVNNVIMDRRLMGANIKGVACYRFAKNAQKYGHHICDVCGARFTNDMCKHRATHERTKKHRDAVEGKITIEKKRRVVY